VADERLRELSRRAALGEAGAETQLLLERVRVGDLGRSWLELLALLGHEPACEALGEPLEGAPFAGERGPLAPWGREAAIRIGLAAVRPLTDRGDALLELIDLATRWLSAEDPRARAEVADRAEGMRIRFGGWGHDHRAALVVAEALAGADLEVGRAITPTAHALAEYTGDPNPTCEEVWAAVREALVPWALEQRTDPSDFPFEAVAEAREARGKP
jgi:hypothetical protein